LDEAAGLVARLGGRGDFAGKGVSRLIEAFGQFAPFPKTRYEPIVSGRPVYEASYGGEGGMRR
jgi:hypothetical protein